MADEEAPAEEAPPAEAPPPAEEEPPKEEAAEAAAEATPEPAAEPAAEEPAPEGAPGEEPSAEEHAEAPAEAGAPTEEGEAPAPPAEGEPTDETAAPAEGEEAVAPGEEGEEDALDQEGADEIKQASADELAELGPVESEETKEQLLDAAASTSFVKGESTESIESKESEMSEKQKKEQDASGAKYERRSVGGTRILGSIISIRRLSGVDVLDKKGARFANTYKLYADNPFNTEMVQKVLESVMAEALENLTYDVANCPKQARWASGMIRTKVKDLNFDRYKLVCLVTIGEKNSQDMLVTCRFLWDAERDRYATYSLQNSHVFGIAQCFGLYYE